MSFFGQPTYGQQGMMGQQPSMFGNMFTTNVQPVNEEAVEQQLSYSGVDPKTARIAAGMASDVVKIKTALPQSVSGLTTQEIGELAIAAAKTSEEGSDSGVRMGQGMGRQGMSSRGTYRPGAPMGPIGNTGMSYGRSLRGYNEVMGGKRSRRTRGRKQRGGYSMSTFSNDAAPITGGRRKSRRHRRRTHKKHGKRSHRR